MEYIEIQDNIIIGHYCGDMPKQKDPAIEYRIIENCAANIGDDVRIYSDIAKGIKKPLKTLIKEGLIAIPSGKKLNESGTELIDMSEAEKVTAGIIQLKPDEKIEHERIVKKTEKELYEAGLISKDAYNASVDKMREVAYKQEADPLGMQVLRGELDRSEWLTKIAEIKKRYPKAE